MKFLRNFFAALLALVTFSFIGFLLFFGIVSIISAEDEVIVEENSVLHIKLDKRIIELEGEDNPFEELAELVGEKSGIGVIDIRRTLRKAAEDDKIKGIYLDAHNVIVGPGNIQEIRNALLEFKKSGKFIYSYADYYSEGGYYLSSVSDKIFLNTEGGVEFNGMATNVFFFKGTFEKLGIEPDIFRVGDFKSAVEPFIREDMSDENRLQLTSLLESLDEKFLQNISKSRGISVDELKEISSQMLVRSPQEAVKLKIVDETIYYDQFLDKLAEKVGVDSPDDYNFISYYDYRPKTDKYIKSDNRVAVIIASGNIVRGKGKQNNNIGGEKFAKEIRKARLDDKIKAIVLRINSPGGDFQASDMMWREIKLASKTKPIIASMADYAASGGYYMAMACDTIVAQPSTITGSIGIFGMFFNLENFMKDKLGITFDVVKTGEHSDINSSTRPLTVLEKEIIQKEVNKGYKTFTNKAANDRNMPIDDLLKIASGRVWTGAQALDNGLVDMLGGLEDAIAVAADKAGIADDYKLKYYPKNIPLIEQILNKGMKDVKAKLINQEIGDLQFYLKKVKNLNEYQGIQARMPYDITIGHH